MYEMRTGEMDFREAKPWLLRILLQDHSRTMHELAKAREAGREPAKGSWNIIWGTDNYLEGRGAGYGREDEMDVEKVTGGNRELVRPRVAKSKEVRRKRSREMAEVFTPSWVCNTQNNLVDEAWFGRAGAFNREYVDKDGEQRWEAVVGRVAFDERPSPGSTRSWQEYVCDVRLEITCGEAPYLVGRYDSVTGRPEMDLNRRVGFLDRKLRVVSENTDGVGEWLEWALAAVKSVYGFEWQGDNLLLAREALLLDVDDYFRGKFGCGLSDADLRRFAEVVSWNVWQMDGLKMVIPYSCHEEEEQGDLFGGGVGKRKCSACAKRQTRGHNGIKCVIRDWKHGGRAVVFEDVLSERGAE